MATERATTISQYSSNPSPMMPRLKIALVQMATFRQATMDASTLKLYSARLGSERFDDVIAALDHLQEQPRQEGETALPEIGSILTLVRVMAARRANREAAATDLEFIAWRCPACKYGVSGYFPRSRNRASEPYYCQTASRRTGSKPGEICGATMLVAHREQCNGDDAA